MKKFPILAVTVEALKLPITQPLQLLKAAGVLIAGFVASVAVMMVMMLAGLVSPTAFDDLAGELQRGDFGNMGALALFIIIMMVALLWAFAFVFNYWVRAGAFGPSAAAMRPFGKAWGAAGVNMIKLVLITILLGLVSLVVVYVLHAVGLAPSFGEQMQAGANPDIAASTRAGIASNIIVTVVSCIVYSIFSANLTETAVGTGKEGLEHPHTVDFAIVLVLLYAVILIPTTLAGLTGSMGLMLAITYPLYFYVSLAIAAAHGLRYRVCVDEPNEEETFS
ncbi:MAG: hypothetical protein EP335_10495 [Alphaproteobacteria bacterium]|nr:MAG: hypothetical protein EP335_10495 [Alphaproteobacteria bacterium]